jgi:hypothetical protein
MKTLHNLYIGLLALSVGMVACQKQNEVEPLNYQHPNDKTEGYYANLRAYKKSDHPIMFGWYGPSGGNGHTPSMKDRWEGLPDSMDIVACWGGFPEYGSAQMKAMHDMQKLKGTRVVLTMFASGFSQAIAKDFSELPVQEGIDAMAKSIADSITKYGLDGIDIDYEPGEASERESIFSQDGGLLLLVRALAPYFGPQSETGKLLIVDGYLRDSVPPYIDYFVSQAYSTSGPGNLQSRFNSAYSMGLPPHKFVITENFESYWSTGGVNYNDPILGTIPSLLGMAYWNPTQGRKGGTGSYHIEYEYNNTPDYRYTREAIQIMNPANR